MKTFKEKILHNSFLTYIRTLSITPVANKRDTSYTVEYLLSFFSFLVMFWIISGFENLGNYDMYFSAMVGAYLYALWLMVGMSRRAKPSPNTLAPIYWKKRVVYNYLSNLVFAIFALLILAAFALIIFLFVSLIVFASMGEWIFITEDTELVTVSVPVQGQLFVIFAGLLIYGAGGLISNIKNKKWRIGATISLPIALELIGLLILNCAHKGGFILTGCIAAEFENLPVSWLWLTVTAVLAVGVTALSVLFAINFEKPSKI